MINNDNPNLPTAPPSVRPVRIGNPMDPGTAPRRFPRWRLAAAFAVAGFSDFLSIVFSLIPPIQWTVDIGTAIMLWMILGWRWQILPGLIAEAIPGIELFPVWILVVAVVWPTLKR